MSPTAWSTADPVERALTISTVAFSGAFGLFYAVSALYFTRAIGLSATTVGVSLTVAGAMGVVTSYAGGALSDWIGADRVQQWSTFALGCSLLAYIVADDTVSFVVVACAAVGSKSLASTARNVVLARWFTGPERVAVRAKLRVVTNLSIGLATCLAGVALVIDTAAAYRATMAAVGFLALGSLVPLGGLRRRIPELAARMRPARSADGTRPPRGRSPLRDRTFLTSVTLNSVIAIQFGLQTVGVPLWIAGRTHAPTVTISLLLVGNTAIVALFQVRAARRAKDIPAAGRAVRLAGGLLAAACLLYAAAGNAGTVTAVALLVAAGILASGAEIYAEAGGWMLAFELADPANTGAYQGLSQAGYAVAGMVAPAIVTLTAIDHGAAGWSFLAALFGCTGAAAAVLAQHAAASRGAQNLTQHRNSGG